MVCHFVHHIDISMESRLVLYADDILPLRPIRTIGDYSALQSDIDALSNWATQNTMTFNTAKCKYMRILGKRSVLSQLHLSF